MSTAERARRAVRDQPFLFRSLQAGVLNYRAVARYLEVGDEGTVASALRRYAEELDTPKRSSPSVRVTFHRDATAAEAVPVESETASAIVVRGDPGVETFVTAIDRLLIEDVTVRGLSYDQERSVIAVSRDDGPAALRLVEESVV